jgi:hypothetical protein
MKPLLALQIRNALKQNKWLPQNVETIDYKHAHQPDSVKSLEKEYLPIINLQDRQVLSLEIILTFRRNKWHT